MPMDYSDDHYGVVALMVYFGTHFVGNQEFSD